MRITFRGKSEKVLKELSVTLDLSPTELLVGYIFSLEKVVNNTAHIEEVKNELQKSYKGFIQQS